MSRTEGMRPLIARKWEMCDHGSLSVTCPNCDAQLMLELPLLDPEHLAEIESLESARPGLRAHMLALFSGSARAGMNTCGSAWKAGNRESLAHAAHRLKGSAASLGAIRLRMLAAGVEKDALSTRGALIGEDRLEELDVALEETITAYREWLEGRR